MPHQKRFSREGFQQLPNTSTHNMVNPNDTTIDIPLTQVTTKTGARKVETSPTGYGPQSTKQQNEKAGYFPPHAAGRRKVATDDSNTRRGADGEEEVLTQMGMIYNKILNFSVITRYLVYVLPVALLFAIPIIIGATAAPNAAAGCVRIVWIFSWVEIVWFSLWGSKLFAKFLPHLFQFLCGIVSSGTRKYALVLQSLEIPISLSGWALTSLATFMPVMTRNPDTRAAPTKNPKCAAIQNWENVMQQILAAFLIASLIFLMEKLIIQFISIGYHRKQFTSKIRESKHNIYLLSLLYDASRTLFPAYCREFAEEDYIINDSLDIAAIKPGSRNRQSGSTTPLRLLQDVGRFGDKITSAFGNIASEIAGKQVFNPGSAHSVVVEALEKNKSSEALAKRLWMSFVVEGKDALYKEDILEVLGSDRQAEAEECFDSLDRDGNGDISLDEMIMTVCEIGRERHSIANSLHDVDQAINVLDGMLCTIVFVMSIFVFVAFLNKSFTTTLATTGTALLSLSFVFATTCQEVLGSCIFLFVKHPFDVLDRVDIGEEQLIVEHISLLFTVFRRVKDHKTTQVPNIVLNTVWIQNVSRSKAMREQLFMYIAFDTSLEDVQLLKDEMQAFVRDKENSRDFQPDIDMEITGIAEMNKLELRVEIRHKSNWANETIRAARRSKFMCALVLAIRKIPINPPGGADAPLGSADKPTYSVAVSDAEAAAARAAYAKKQDGKRLVPKKDPPPPITDYGSTTDVPDHIDPATPPPLRYRSPTITETAALTSLNARHPAADTAASPKDLDIDTHIPERDSSDLARSTSIEEVRGLLRRQSTRGKRRPPGSSPAPHDGPSPISEIPPPPRVQVEYQPYVPSSLPAYTVTGPQSPTTPTSPTIATATMAIAMRANQALPPRPDEAGADTSPPPRTSSAAVRPGAESPVANPYTLLTPRGQQQGVPGVIRRPVPGGNSFAAAGEGRVVREEDHPALRGGN